MAGFCQEAVIFRAAFSNPRLASVWAKGIRVSGDRPQHIINKGCDGSGLVLGPGGGIGELTQGIQASFEGDAAEIDVVCQGGFLHDTADEIISDEMHAQFAFDHVRRQTAQHIHVEVDLDLTEVKFDAPAAEIEFGKIRVGNSRVQKGCHKSYALRAKAAVAHGVANNPHGDTLG